MSYNSQILMPGNFHLDLPTSGSRGASFSGVHPGIFRPPTSPSVSSSMHLGRSTTSLQSDILTPIPNAKRKRLGARASTPVGDWTMTGDGHFMTDNTIDGRSDFDIHTNGFGRRYVLAGQMDTPNGVAQRDFENMEDSVYSDIDYRRALGPKRPRDDVDSLTTAPMAVDSDSRVSGGWGSYAISTIGDVVGRVWEFCKTGAFRGFYAGGGTGYEFSDAARQPMWDTSPSYGGLPQANHSPYYYERDTPESTPPPPPKRRQISYGTPTDELRKNWVMIDEPANTSQQPPLASRPLSRHSVQRTTAPSSGRRISKPVSRLNPPSYNRHPPSRPIPASSVPIPSREPASFASFRSPTPSPGVRAQTPSRIPVPAASQAHGTLAVSHLTQQPSRIPSPSPYARRGHRRSQSSVSSSASPVKVNRRESLHEMHDNATRLDAKAKNLAARRMKDELETDMRINDFNARLKDMIRQGKEALGTTYEVELDYDDGRGDPWESE